MKRTSQHRLLILTCLWGLLLSASAAFAVKAKPTPTVVHQPDGTPLIVCGHGDEWYHFAETEEGYSVVTNEEGWWVYAALGTDGKYTPSLVIVRPPDRRGETENRFLNGTPKHLREDVKVRSERTLPIKQKGGAFLQGIMGAAPMQSRSIQNPIKLNPLASRTIRALILLVQFPDMPSVHSAESFQRLFNDDTWESGSVNTYFNVNTGGTVQITADVKGWMTAAHPLSYYANRNPNDALHVAELIRAAVNQAENEGVDFSKYDNDGDGEVDALFIVHAGPGAEEGVRTQYIWSHASSLSWNSLDVKYDGVTISDYTIEPELEGDQHSGIGVFCHEFGHQLGLPDLYDANYGEDGESSGLGLWDLMASGSWGANGKNVNRPVGLSAWSREYMGLVNPVEVSTSPSLSIGSQSVYKVWLDPYRDSQYLLIENRQKTGFNQDMLGSGLFVYRINRDRSDNFPFSNSINTVSAHLGVGLLQADGLKQMDLNYNDGDAGDPFPGITGNTAISHATNPGTDLEDGSGSDVSILEISPSSAAMTANVIANAPKGYSQQYYKRIHGLYGSPSSDLAYGLIKFTPESNGQLLMMKVFLSAAYLGLQVNVYGNISGGNPVALKASSQVSNPTLTKFYDARFDPGVAVTKGTPIYVELRYERNEPWYQIPIDFYTPYSGNCYASLTGKSYVQITYNIAARAVFSSTKLEAPVLVYPMNGQKDKPSQIDFRWSAPSGAVSYQLQVAKDSLFQTMVYDNASITAVLQKVTGLALNTKFYWRVRASNAGGSSAWSGVSTFWTAAVTGLPVKVALRFPPSNSIDRPVTTTLDWNVSDGALKYRIQVAGDSLFSSLVFDDSTLTGTSVQPLLRVSTKYFWRANAGNAIGKSPWSDVWNFHTVDVDSTQWTLYSTSNTTLPQNSMDPIVIDSDGSKWIGGGFYGYGLVKFDGKTWTAYRKSNSQLPSDTVWTLLADRDGSLWIGTHSGLSNWNKDAWRHFNNQNSGLPYDDVRALALDSKGNLWIGTGYGGVARYDGSGFSVYNTSSGLPSNEIISVAAGAKDTVWVGTYKGLARFDGLHWTTFTKSNSNLPSDLVSAIAIDASGRKWIGTSGGLSVLNGSSWSTYTSANSQLPDAGIHSITIEADGTAWLATRGGGLVKIKGSDWTVYNLSNSGLVTEALRHAAVASDGTKWITSDGGLVAFKQSASSPVETISMKKDELPGRFTLSTNYPNPFNPETTIRFGVKDPCRVVLKVYNLLGKEVARVVDAQYQPGLYEARFHAGGLVSGIYLYRIQMGNFQAVKKMVILE